MPGIRLQHPTARTVRYTVVEPEVPYTEPFTCTPPFLGGCGSVHLFKTHHLNLDDTGACIVSTGVFDRIKDRLALDGFVVTNEVAKPPGIGVGMAPPDLLRWGNANIPIVHSPTSIERK